MTKDFNNDLDQSTGEKQREHAKKGGRDTHTAPHEDAEAARKRTGEGFKSPGDEHAESGSRGAGYRETKPDKK